MENKGKGEDKSNGRARSKAVMYQTFKIAVFSKITASDGSLVPTVDVVGGHYLVVDEQYCDLRTAKERYDPSSKELASSAISCVLSAESFLTSHYGKRIGEHDTLYDFISVDCYGGSDYDPDVKTVKNLLCFSGLHVPLNRLEEIGWRCHDEVEIVEIVGKKYVRYRAVMQSASENRQCKLTMTTYGFEGFARTISGDAEYLREPTATAQKAISRQGLAKTNGKLVQGFDFSFALVPDLELDISFSARCFYDSQNKITEEVIITKKNCNDGCGYIISGKAKELADRLGLSYVPSAFQVRYGQVKGILLVFDFDKYTDGVIWEDIIFTRSMWKADFDAKKAEFLVANVSKRPRRYAEMNYQMFTTLNNQICFDDILPYVDSIKEFMQKALSTPEGALQFLGLLSDISDWNSELDDGGEGGEAGGNSEYNSVDRVSAVIQANPQLAMNIRWVKQSIKRRIDQVSKKMLAGKIPMPRSSVTIMGCDPIAFFNRLRVDRLGHYSFEGENEDCGGVGADKKLVVPKHKQARELAAYEFYRGSHAGKLLATRNPLTHHAQIRKLNCVTNKGSSYWYRHLGQVILFNVHDETNLGMGGADFDGDMCILTELFIDKFQQTDYIIYNNNDVGDSGPKVILTEEVAQNSIRANLAQNMLGLICNINTRVLELLNDKAALGKFVRLAGYKNDRSFGIDAVPQMPYLPKFKDMDTAAAYLEKLNHELTTLSELEVDRPKTGYINRFCQNRQEYTLPFTPLWFGHIKGQLHQFANCPFESYGQNNFGESVRTLTKDYSGKIVKKVHDTLKADRSTKKEPWVQRTIEMMADGDTIMGHIHRYIKDNILDMEIDMGSSYSIIESLKSAACLDIAEADRILEEVRFVYKSYCREVAGSIKALRQGDISAEDFSNSLAQAIDDSDDLLRQISSDRVAIAYAAYILSQESDYGSQSFPFLVALDGMAALLSDLRTVDYYDISVNLAGEQIIPPQATHLIVYNKRFRLPESICPDKTYFGNQAPLPNGSYEIHRDLKGEVSLIIPKATPKGRLNTLPFSDTAEFSLKISYKASELSAEHQNGEYVTGLMRGGYADGDTSVVTFRETTMDGNKQFCVFVEDIWVGIVFDDQGNDWVLKRDVVKALAGNNYVLAGIPRTGVKTDSNSFKTKNGNYRTAQVLSFVKQCFANSDTGE